MKLGSLIRIDNVLKPNTFKNFKSMMDLINKKNIKIIIDVTPKWHGKKCENQDYIDFVKTQIDNGHILALHGVEHRCRIMPEEEHIVSWKPTEDEFDCKDYHLKYGKDIPIKTQREWLKEGNGLLQEYFGKTTDLLMPPAHAFNLNTLKAMREEGFTTISAYGRWDASPYIKEGIIVLPFDFEDYVKNTLEDGSNSEAMFQMFKKYFDNSIKQKGYYATFLHCDFSGEGNISIERLKFLEKILDYVTQTVNFVDPHIFIKYLEGKY